MRSVSSFSMYLAASSDSTWRLTFIECCYCGVRRLFSLPCTCRTSRNQKKPMAAVTTPAPTILEPEFRSIYSNGDLILVNPQQSTAIFVSVIVFSTLLEYVIERIQQAKNRYVRTIVLASKDEITNMGFVTMVLLFVAFSFPLAASWRVVSQWVVMCLTYMAFGYVFMISVILAMMSLRVGKWRVFEWARIEADAHHSSSEQLFKTAREYFVLLVRATIPEHSDRLEDSSLVTFSSYLARVERRHLADITDFSFKTWFGLGLMIIVNGARALTAATIQSNKNLIQVLTYIGITGYGTLILYLIAHGFFQRRFRNYLFQQIVSVQNGTVPELDRATTPQQCFFFRSMTASLEVFKVTQLCFMWYIAVQIMAYTYVAWIEVEWFALLIYLGAAIPVIAFLYIYPWTLNLIFMCQALGTSYDADLVRRLLMEEVAASDSDSDEDSDGEFDDEEEADKKKKKSGSAGILDAELLAVEDEWTGPDVTLHSSVPEDQAPKGEPAKLVGVPPANKFQHKPSRPIFVHGTH